MMRKFRHHLGRPEILRLKLGPAPCGGSDDLRPMVRVNFAAVTPLAHRDTGLANVGRHRFGVVVPHGEDFVEV